MSSRGSIDRFLQRVESGDYFARLVNHPAPHRLRTAPRIVYHSTLHHHEPQLTVVTPTFNYEPIIRYYIDATAAAASVPFDWIIVDDGSQDGTAERARTIFESTPYPLVARATILRNPVPIFETACDNIGFTLAETDVIVEIQGDIQVREPATSYPEPTLLFRNLRNGKFLEVGAELGPAFTENRVWRGLAIGDFDGAGDPDLLVSTCGGKPALLRNDGGNQSHWLQGKAIAILGYGSQGHAHALNLKEGGHRIAVGLRAGRVLSIARGGVALSRWRGDVRSRPCAVGARFQYVRIWRVSHLAQPAGLHRRPRAQ